MTFREEIIADIDWRMSELASLKTIPLRYNMLLHHQEILVKYIVLALYALWEGFVKSCLQSYIRELNKLQLNISDVDLNVLTHALTCKDKLVLENPRVHFTKKKEFVKFYQEQISHPLLIDMKLPTKSNIDYKVLNELLLRFNLEGVPEEYDSKLKKLLRFRNTIAHGDNSIPVTFAEITEFSTLISDLMVVIYDKIEKGYNEQSFKA